MNFRVPVETNIAYWLVYLHFQFIWSCIPCIAMEVLWSFYLHSRMWLWLAWGLICCRRFRKETLLYKRVYQIYWKNVRCFDWALDTRVEENYASTLVVGISLKIIIGFCGSGKENIVAAFGHYISKDVL